MSELNKSRILVVDDTAATRYSVTRTLKAAGFEVAETVNGRETLEYVKQNSPDLILLDIQLPDMLGYQIVEKIRDNPQTSSIPIIHASATNISNEDQAFGLEGGADAYLIHPLDPLILVATVRAILRMKEAESKLRHSLLEKESIVAQLNLERQLREEFVLSISHDLKSPLTAAQMNAQLALRNMDNKKTLMRVTSRVIDNLDRANRMIDDLLDANRIRAGEKLTLKIEECDLGCLLADIINDSVAVHGDRFECACDPGIVVYWDCGGLRRAMENLCNNAVKYGNKYDAIKIRVIKSDSRVLISVNNRGVPLSKEEMDVLFLPHHRTRGAISSGSKGWGLGLTLVKGFATSHQGSVRVESDELTGTTFILDLPLNAGFLGQLDP